MMLLELELCLFWLNYSVHKNWFKLISGSEFESNLDVYMITISLAPSMAVENCSTHNHRNEFTSEYMLHFTLWLMVNYPKYLPVCLSSC